MSLTWQEEARTTEPVKKHQHVVENILRDKADGWRHDYYKDLSTGYDIHVGKTRMEIARYKANAKKHEAALDKITATLEASKKDPKHPGYKKLTAKQAEEMEAEYIEVYKLKCEQLVFLDGAEKALQEWSWKQYVQKKRLILLQWIRNNYMLDGDVDYMERAVTWVEEYIDRIRKCE